MAVHGREGGAYRGTSECDTPRSASGDNQSIC